MDIATSLNSSADTQPNPRAMMADSSKVGAEGASHDYVEEWPSIEETSPAQRPYNDVVKSISGQDSLETALFANTSMTSSTPKLTQVTPSQGKGGRDVKDRQAKNLNNKGRFPPTTERLSKEDMDFLSTNPKKFVNDKNRKNLSLDGSQPKKSTSRGSAPTQGRNRKKQKNITSGGKSQSLSSKQKQTMTHLGLEPNSGFVQSIMASKGKKM